MKLANIHILSEDTELDPKLAECVNKVALARPELTFTFDVNKHRSYKAGFALEHGSTLPGKHYARRVDVTQDDIYIGNLTIDRAYRNGASGWRIYVASREVRPFDRRVHGYEFESTHTSNMDTAVRNAKKFLVRPQLGVVLYERGTQVIKQYESALNRLEVHIARQHSIASPSDVQLLLNAYLRGQEPDARLVAEYRAVFTTPVYETAMSEYMLAQHMRNHPDGVMPICLMPGGLYSFFTGGELLGSLEDASKADVPIVPFEALPEVWQDRIAVLQLLSDKEMVKDVGYRANSEMFIIVK